VFLLGTCVLVDAVWAAVGEDPLRDVLGALLPVLDAAVLGLDSQVAADAGSVQPGLDPVRGDRIQDQLVCSAAPSMSVR